MPVNPFDPYTTPFRQWSPAQIAALFSSEESATNAANAVLRNLYGNPQVFNPSGNTGLNPYGQFLRDAFATAIRRLMQADQFGLAPFSTGTGWDLTTDPTRAYDILSGALQAGQGDTFLNLLSDRYNPELFNHLLQQYQKFTAGGGVGDTLTQLFNSLGTSEGQQAFLSQLANILNPSPNPIINAARRAILSNLMEEWGDYSMMHPEDTSFLGFVAKRLGYR